MIVFDLDGTLADIEHRRHFVTDTREIAAIGESHLVGKWKPNWKAFYEACDKDVPLKATICVLFELVEAFDIEIWSGRCESVREKTVKWLHEHCPRFSHCELKMRPIGDFTPDDVLKERWLDEAIAEGKTIDFVFDDRPKVVRMWRRRGIFVFNCCQHENEF